MTAEEKTAAENRARLALYNAATSYANHILSEESMDFDEAMELADRLEEAAMAFAEAMS